MAAIGLIPHRHRPEAETQTLALARQLCDAGHEVRLPAADAADVGLDDLAVAEAAFAEGLDFAVTLGGDGSILRAVALIGAAEVPVLGVDFGELGYLTAVEPDDAPAAVDKVLAGDYELEHRMMVMASLTVDGERRDHHALNEVVVERGATSTTVSIEVAIDGVYFHTYPADGLIVATPTGSTAYSLSARGPIVDATHRVLLLTPVSPHLLFDRSMVLQPSSTVDLTVRGHRDARLSVDGRTVASLTEGDTVSCTVSPREVRLITVAPRNFHAVLKAKFGLTDR